MKIDDIETQIFDIIHDVTIENQVYSAMYFADSKELTKHTFMFNFRHHAEDDIAAYTDDVKFLLDNIIAKVIEINYKINHLEYHRTELGNFIHFDGSRAMNPFIVHEYEFIEPIPIANIDEYLEDLNITSDESGYTITWTLPILEINKGNIQIR